MIKIKSLTVKNFMSVGNVTQALNFEGHDLTLVLGQNIDLGGDDAGGGVHWAPQVVEDAADHGLILGENGKLYDQKKGQKLPDHISPMPVMRSEELAKRAELTTRDVVPNHVARFWDMFALSDSRPVNVIGENGLLRDKPGFEVDFITRSSAIKNAESHRFPSVLMPVRGHWRISWDGDSAVLAPGDTMSVPAELNHSIVPAVTGEAALYDCMTRSVSETVRRQKEVGVDIVSDGETSKISYATYVKDRYTGFDGDSPRNAPADLKKFPSFLERLANDGGTPTYARPMCVGEVKSKGQGELEKDIKNLKAAFKLVKKKYITEASGGVNLNNIKKIAATGVDRVFSSK